MKQQYLVKCECGWRGAESALRRNYILVPPDDVAPVYKCPHCGKLEDDCQWFKIKEIIKNE